MSAVTEVGLSICFKEMPFENMVLPVAIAHQKVVAQEPAVTFGFQPGCIGQVQVFDLFFVEEEMDFGIEVWWERSHKPGYHLYIFA